MSEKLQPVRGTHDILPDEARQRRFITERFADITERYGYGEIATPIFEFSDVFHRTLGDTSDVVTKETYSFTDRGGESLTLRPEFTASVVRALISNGLTQELPFKVRYYGPAFRYERPQKGRQRQFYQLGAELIGAPEPMADAEMIAMAAQLLSALGLQEHVTLEINSLGDAASRSAYRTALVAYFSAHREQLSEESKIRLDKNPLRILDSKDEGDKKLVAGAPAASEYFTPEATEFFATVQRLLSAVGVEFRVNPCIVRGLDYYSHTVFEFTTHSLGAQGTVLAGGRYDGLVKMMGGPDIPGVGFAAGVERLLALMEVAGSSANVAAQPRPVAVIPVDTAQEEAALVLAQRLRTEAIPAEVVARGNMGKRMKRAEKLHARAALILGESELASGQVTVKYMDEGSQKTCALADIVKELNNAF
jgi:histidyl-tRNA synthetase